MMTNTETAAVIEAAKVWKARRINRDPAGFRPELYTRACDELDQAVSELVAAEQATAARAALQTRDEPAAASIEENA